MSAYFFRELAFEWPEKLTSGTWLWIWNADKIPPHIGISKASHYFSLTYKKCEIQKSVSAMVRKVKRLQIPLVLVDLSDVNSVDDFTEIFQQFEYVGMYNSTCLTPIKQVLKISYAVAQLSDLLTILEKSGKMKSVFAVHLTSAYAGIPDYTVSEILQRIEHLHETKRPESTTASR